jgi:hypothetical protein
MEVDVEHGRRREGGEVRGPEGLEEICGERGGTAGLGAALGSRQDVVGVLEEQLEQLGRPGEEPEDDGAQLVGSGARVGGDGDHAPTGLVGDDPGDGGVDDPDSRCRQVSRQLGHASGKEHLRLAAADHRPGQRQPVLQVEHVGQRVGRGGDTRAAGEGDLAEAEVLHARCALPAALDQRVSESTRAHTIGIIGGVGGVHRRPLGKDIEVADFSQPTVRNSGRRAGPQTGRVDGGCRSCVRLYGSSPTSTLLRPSWAPRRPVRRR